MTYTNRAHSPTFPSLHLRHSSISKPSIALPTSQLSPTLSLLHLRHSSFSNPSFASSSQALNLGHLANRPCFRKLCVYIRKTITLPVVLYGCETRSLTLREEYRLRVFENKVFRKISGVLREIKLQENGESYIMLSYMHCILRITSLGILNRDD